MLAEENGHNVPHEEDGLFMACTSCKTKFDDFEFDKIYFLESCSHIVCKACIVQIVKSDYIKKQKADCPDCGEQINEYEIKALLGEEMLSKLHADAINAIVKGDQSIVQCPCGNAIEASEGKVDYNVKDDDGKKLTRKAAEHMSKHRIRCHACKNNFCTSCLAQPYHIGKSCEEFKEFSESIKCRFCGDAIQAGLVGGAFKDVCKKKECKGMIKQSCDKIHECGHPCKGFAREKKCLPCLHED